MNSIYALLIAAVVAVIGYRFYSKYVDEEIIKADPKKATPAKMYMDGVDFMPTSKYVLYGFQFKSIAALGPVTGPIIAIQWGWLPCLLWIVLGTLFIGWVQDYTSTMIGVRNEGQTFGALSYRFISPRARVILLIFIYFYLLLIVAAFGDLIATMMATLASVPLALIALMVTGIVAGYMIYKLKKDIIMVTVLMVVLSLLSIWLGTMLPIPGGKGTWIIYALFFSFLGAVLPIWSYAQPINYISFYLVTLGILGSVIGIIIGRPPFIMPAFTTFTIGVGPLWPLLFVTIACGAISGWHSLVSSSGTARQVESELDVRPVGGGSMFLEMLLATLALVMAAILIPSAPEYGKKMKELGGPAGLFAAGMSNLLGYMGIPEGFGRAFSGAIFVILAITVCQLVVRFMRVATAELLGDAIPLMRNVYVGSFIAVLLGWILITTGTFGYIWVLFGGSNQLMAALALMLVSIWLCSEKKTYGFTYWPMLFMFVTTVTALCITSYRLLSSVITGKVTGAVLAGNLISGAIGVLLVIAALLLALDGYRGFCKVKAGIGK